MKKLWIALFLLLFLVGCGKAVNDTSPNTDVPVSDGFEDGAIDHGVIDLSREYTVVSQEVIDGIPVAEVEWCNDVPWLEGDPFFTPDEDVLEVIHPIGTKETAIEVARAILGKYHEKGKIPEETLDSVKYSSKNNLWCFSYYEPEPDEVDTIMLGGGWCIVVDGNKGSFVKAWIEE